MSVVMQEKWNIHSTILDQLSFASFRGRKIEYRV